MNYFQAKSDLEFIIQFQNDVLAMLGMEKVASETIQSRNSWMGGFSPGEWQALIQQKASEQSRDYQTIRMSVARGVSRAQHLAARHAVPSQFASYPAPAIGGPVIHLGIFEAILTDNSHGGIGQQMICDTMNRVIGACEEEKERSWRELVNPFHWIKNIVLLILRIPFMLIEATGFNVSKFEDHLFGKVFKLLMLLGFAFGLIKLGFERAELVEILKSIGSSAGKGH